MRSGLVGGLLGCLAALSACAGEDGGLPPASSEQCCPLVRLCAACGCDPAARTASDADDTQACIQELESAQGCREEVWGSAKRTCDANGQRADTEIERSVVGDWFRCRDPECTELSGMGTRYTEDGRVLSLTFPQPADFNSVRPHYEGDPYCVMGELGTYRYDVASGELETTTMTSSTPITSTSAFYVNGDYAVKGMLRVRENATGAYSVVDGREICDVSGAMTLD